MIEVPAPPEAFDLTMGDGAAIRVRRHGRAHGEERAAAR